MTGKSFITLNKNPKAGKTPFNSDQMKIIRDTATFIKKMLQKQKLFLCFFLLLYAGSSCQTFYQQQRSFNNYLERGEIDKAVTSLDENKRFREGRNRLLYQMNKGTVLQLQGEYEKSNEYLEMAYSTAQNYTRNIGRTAMALMTNPSTTEYFGEDFELILIHYYKALNFLLMERKDAALVEARRINNQLQAVSSQYSRENRYKRDAFGHLLMGIIFDASGHYNDAFIAYRNAHEIYSEDYQQLFGMRSPDQLKKDLVRTAHETGFIEQRDRYMREFKMDKIPQNESDAELVFFWHNGLGPVKDEWSISFQVIHLNNEIIFINQSLDLHFAFSVTRHEQQQRGLTDIKFLRVAFPRYVSREKYYEYATLNSGDRKQQLQLAQDIDKVAKRNLRDRMNRELAEGLLRLAIKKAGEYKIREQNQWLGILAGAANMATEKADTRHWQSIPHSIYYSRFPLEEGQNEITLKRTPYHRPGNKEKHTFTINAEKGENLFHFHHDLSHRKAKVK